MKIPDLYKSDTTEIVQYVNTELSKGRNQKDIEINDFRVNEKVLKNRLSRRGYKKNNNQWVLDTTKSIINNTTNNITKSNTDDTTNNTTNSSKKENKPKVFTNKEIENMNKLLNLDIPKLEKIINEYEEKPKTEIIRSGNDKNTSLRIDQGIYNIFKLKVKTNGEKVGETLNKLMIEYINKN